MKNLYNFKKGEVINEIINKLNIHSQNNILVKENKKMFLYLIKERTFSNLLFYEKNNMVNKEDLIDYFVAVYSINIIEYDIKIEDIHKSLEEVIQLEENSIDTNTLSTIIREELLIIESSINIYLIDINDLFPEINITSLIQYLINILYKLEIEEQKEKFGNFLEESEN